MKKMMVFLALGIGVVACAGDFFNEMIYQSMAKEEKYHPAGCINDHEWNDYDCGDGGIGFCQHRVDIWRCEPDRVKEAMAQYELHGIDRVEVCSGCAIQEPGKDSDNERAY